MRLLARGGALARTSLRRGSQASHRHSWAAARAYAAAPTRAFLRLAARDVRPSRDDAARRQCAIAPARPAHGRHCRRRNSAGTDAGRSDGLGHEAATLQRIDGARILVAHKTRPTAGVLQSRICAAAWPGLARFAAGVAARL